MKTPPQTQPLPGVTMTTTATDPAELFTPDARNVELAIGGMTCASCAARIEKKLNKLDGVTATVNYATEKAKVSYAGSRTPEELIATVEQAGYTARLPQPPKGAADAAQRETAVDHNDDDVRLLRQRFAIS